MSDEQYTIEEANYRTAKCCSYCIFGTCIYSRGGDGYWCDKLKVETSVDGVCKYYE